MSTKPGHQVHAGGVDLVIGSAAARFGAQRQARRAGAADRGDAVALRRRCPPGRCGGAPVPSISIDAADDERLERALALVRAPIRRPFERIPLLGADGAAASATKHQRHR